MNNSGKDTRYMLADIVTYLLVLLFVSTGIDKLLHIERNAFVLGQMPLLRPISEAVAIGVPVMELLIVVLLIVPATRKLSFYTSLAMLGVFTIYLAGMLLTRNDLPCTCGGIVQQLSWIQHLLLNMILIVLILCSLKSERRQTHVV